MIYNVPTCEVFIAFRWLWIVISNFIIHSSRVSGVSVARADLQGKEVSEVEWDYQGHRETMALKDNLWVSATV